MVDFIDKQYSIEIWKGEYLGGSVACDTETEIKPFTETPRMVAFQAYCNGDKVYYVERNDVEKFLEVHTDSKLIFHNFPFDADVIAFHVDNKRVWDSFIDKGLIYDTQIMYKLVHLASYGYAPHKSSLAHVVKTFFNVELDKGDDLRMTWGEYLDKPLSDIPLPMLEYGSIDAIATKRVYQKLRIIISGIQTPSYIKESCLSQNIQIKGALALNHIYKNGISFNSEKAEGMLKQTESKLEEMSRRLRLWNWVRGKRGTKDAYERAIQFIGLEEKLPRTEDGSISSKEEHLEPYRNINFIDDYLNYHSLEKELSFFKELIGKDKVHPRYNLIVNTGRTSCSKPNFQQLPRSGEVRSLFRADKGKTLVITDYSAIELATLAQICYTRYGHSIMREKINDGQDLHRYYASVLYSIHPDNVTKDQRQKAKAANFGFPGGLGIDTFIQFSRGYGLELTQEDAREMKEVWFKAFPEVETYLNDDNGGHAWTLTGRLRNDCTYCAERNTPFQGLAADGAKIALYNLDRAGYHIVGFVHDEIIVEVDLATAKPDCENIEKIMVDSMHTVVPDVRISVESEISKEYCK